MATGWLKGAVKAVPSGNSLLTMGSIKGGPPPKKTVILVGHIVPKLVQYLLMLVYLSIGIARLPGAYGAIRKCTLFAFCVWSDLIDWQPW
jgi:hypothetical protein